MIQRYSWSIVSTLLVCGLTSCMGSAPEAPKPNVLILYSDQHTARVLGASGFGAVHTPNMDRLAAAGIRFSHTVASHPLCTPSRASFQTGYYAERHGATFNGTLMNPPNTTYFAEVFAESGYATGYIGKWHLDGARKKARAFKRKKRALGASYVAPMRRRGYQEWMGYDRGLNHDEPKYWDDSADPPRLVFPEEYDWEPTFQRDTFLGFAQRHGEAERPWMYFVSIGPPHVPNEPPEEFLSRYDLSEIAIPNWVSGTLTDVERRTLLVELQMYYAQVTAIDDEIGRILDGLDALGQTENTLVVYSSDHGDLLGSHLGESWKDFVNTPLGIHNKIVPFSNSARIPLIMSWPGHIPAGLVVDALVSNVDVPPTILSLAGLPTPSRMQGVSLRDWCLGGKGPDRDAIYLSIQGKDGSDDSSYTAAWTGRYLFSEGIASPVLYDYSNDPNEKTNLFGTAGAVDIQAELSAVLSALETEVRADEAPVESGE